MEPHAPSHGSASSPSSPSSSPEDASLSSPPLIRTLSSSDKKDEKLLPEPHSSDVVETMSSEVNTSIPNLILDPAPPPAGAIGGDLAEEEAPCTPSKAGIRTFSAPELPAKDSPSSPSSSNRSSRAWSPSLSGSRPSSSSISLSRQASIANAATRLPESGSPLKANDSPTQRSERPSGSQLVSHRESPQESAASATVVTPRSGPTRKRMSLSYIATPSSSSILGSPTPSSTSSASVSRSGFPKPSLQRSATAMDTFKVRTAPASQTSYTLGNGVYTPTREHSHVPWPSSEPLKDDPHTTMESAKDFLAEIARRERRIGELRLELKQEEASLKDLQVRWQASVRKEMANINSPDLNKLRAPRQANGARGRSITAATAPSNAMLSPSVGGGQDLVSQPSQTDVAATMAEAMRGFSAKLPAGLSSQLNSLIDGLNVPTSTASASPQGPPRGLGILTEEATDLAPVAASSHLGGSTPQSLAPGPNSSTSVASVPTPSGLSAATSTPSGNSKRASNIFGSLSAFKGQIEESLKAAQQPSGGTRETSSALSGSGGQTSHKAVGIDGLPVSPLLGHNDAMSEGSASQGPPSSAAGWSQWSKKLKDAASDAAARAEKAFGDAITYEGSSANEIVGKESASDRATGSMPISGSALASSNRAESMTKTRRGSRSPTLERRSFTEENEREKAALAEMELGWLSNLVGGGGGGGSSSSGEVPTSPETQPRRLSDRTLLALSEGDGLAPEPGSSRHPTKRNEGGAPSRPSNMRKNSSQSDVSSTSASKRQSMMLGGNLFGMLSSAWGADKVGGGGGGSVAPVGEAGMIPTGTSADKEKDKAQSSMAGTDRKTSMISPNRRPLQDRLKGKALNVTPVPGKGVLDDKKDEQKLTTIPLPNGGANSARGPSYDGSPSKNWDWAESEEDLPALQPPLKASHRAEGKEKQKISHTERSDSLSDTKEDTTKIMKS